MCVSVAHLNSWPMREHFRRNSSPVIFWFAAFVGINGMDLWLFLMYMSQAFFMSCAHICVLEMIMDTQWMKHSPSPLMLLVILEGGLFASVPWFTYGRREEQGNLKQDVRYFMEACVIGLNTSSLASSVPWMVQSLSLVGSPFSTFCLSGDGSLALWRWSTPLSSISIASCRWDVSRAASAMCKLMWTQTVVFWGIAYMASISWQNSWALAWHIRFSGSSFEGLMTVHPELVDHVLDLLHLRLYLLNST